MAFLPIESNLCVYNGVEFRTGRGLFVSIEVMLHICMMYIHTLEMNSVFFLHSFRRLRPIQLQFSSFAENGISLFFIFVHLFVFSANHFQMNGNVDLQVGATTQQQKPLTDFKLLVDPALGKGAQKIYRHNGIVPNDPTYPPVIPKDPRNATAYRLRQRLEPLELPVARYTHIMPNCNTKIKY